MDNVQKHTICNNLPSSENFGFYLRMGKLKYGIIKPRIRWRWVVSFRTKLFCSGARRKGSPYQGLLKIERSWTWIMEGNGESGSTSTSCVHSVHIVQATHKVAFCDSSLLGPLNVTVHLVRVDVQFLPALRSEHWRCRDWGTTPPVAGRFRYLLSLSPDFRRQAVLLWKKIWAKGLSEKLVSKKGLQIDESWEPWRLKQHVCSLLPEYTVS
jgi:hypothetical protein